MNSPEGLESSSLPSIADFGIESRELLQRPKPGEKAAMGKLFSFLDERGRTYRKDMSSPITGWNACSRLSPYLSLGCISIRQIFFHTRRKQRKIKVNPRSKENKGWSSSLTSFQSRLAWHCHFIQRLEAGATMDVQALNLNWTHIWNEISVRKGFLHGVKVRRVGRFLMPVCVPFLLLDG